MPVLEVARLKIHDGKKSGNNFRFIPHRAESALRDKRVGLRSLPYLRVINEPENPILVGAVIGPNHEVKRPGNVEAGEDTVVIEKYTKVIPLKQVTKAIDTVPIRDWLPPEEAEKPEDEQRLRKFIDWASFQNLPGEDPRLVKYLGNNTVNVEVWSGLFEPLREEHFQLTETLLHGSVAYSGGKNVAKAKKAIIDPSEPEADQKLARKMARTVEEKHGPELAGNPIWSVKTWEIEYSKKDTEIVVVRHNSAIYTVEVEDGEAVVITKYTGKEAATWLRRFLKHLAKQLVAEQTKAKIDEGVARQSSAA